MNARLLFVLIVATCSSLFAQSPRTVSVLVEAKSDINPSPRISLSWPRDTSCLEYTVSRKELSWQSFVPMESLDRYSSGWIDSTIEVGYAYEYSIIKTIIADSLQAFGYVAAGVDAAVSSIRGDVLLLVDETMIAPLASELDRLRADLWNEGWTSSIQPAPRTQNFDSAAVRTTKNLVRSWYNKLNETPGFVFIIGRVAVPYSGMVFNNQIYPGPDGHAEHSGAWAADTYYGCMSDDNLWTDVVNNVRGIYPDNQNLVGDGKFDNLLIPGPVHLRVGRVDMYNMGLFYRDSVLSGSVKVVDSVASERNLVRAYLNRDHNYRTGQIQQKWRGLIDDNFGAYGEQFARCGWMNFSALLGRSNIFSVDYLSILDTASYLWSYGCGGGGNDFQSAGGVGTSTMISRQRVNSLFTMLFGSYFGNWDKANNLLRAPLAAATGALTNCWAGRPFWFFHPMQVGSSIGDCSLLSMNNTGTYVRGSYAHGIHMALMGDPTLRMDYGKVPAPTNLSVTQVWSPSNAVVLKWTAPNSADVVGYYVYKQHQDGSLQTLNGDALVSSTEYHDEQFFEGNVRYVVRSVGKLRSNSGSFLDISPPAEQTLRVTSVTDATLLARLNILTYPNPAHNALHIQMDLPHPSPVRLEVYSTRGELIRSIDAGILAASEQHMVWDCCDTNSHPVPHGVYVLRVSAGPEVVVQRVIVAQ